MINFRHATDRNTKCYRLRIGALHLLISYETVVAAENGRRRVRLDNTWGQQLAGTSEKPAAVGSK